MIDGTRSVTLGTLTGGVITFLTVGVWTSLTRTVHVVTFIGTTRIDGSSPTIGSDRSSRSIWNTKVIRQSMIRLTCYT